MIKYIMKFAYYHVLFFPLTDGFGYFKYSLIAIWGFPSLPYSYPLFISPPPYFSYVKKEFFGLGQCVIAIFVGPKSTISCHDLIITQIKHCRF